MSGRTWLALALLLPSALAQVAPEVLRYQIPNRDLAQGAPFQLGGVACLATQPNGHPFLVWATNGRFDAPRTPPEATTWLTRRGADLVHGAFAPAFVATRTVRDHAVLVFELRHRGVPLLDAEIWLCFDAQGCVGIYNHVPANIASPPAPPAEATEPCYYVRRKAGADDKLVVASRKRSSTDSHDIVEFVTGTETLHRELTPKPRAGVDAVTATFTVFTVTGFPDQIQADSRGTIWVSEPTGGRLIALDPQTGAVTSHSTSPWAQPDGLCIDDKDRVWTGFLATGYGLGRLDPGATSIVGFAPPYQGAKMAIPTWASNGTIWVSDHLSTRMSPFSTVTNTFGTPVMMPAYSFPTAGAFEPETGDVFVPLFMWNGLAQLRNGTLVGPYPAPVYGRPTFATAVNGKVWFTYWLRPSIGSYDPRTGSFATYNLLPTGEMGPIDAGPNGRIYVGSRVGYIFEFDPVTGTSQSFAIPASSTILKDGLTVAPDGTVWFTSVNGTIVRMRLS